MKESLKHWFGHHPLHGDSLQQIAEMVDSGVLHLYHDTQFISDEVSENTLGGEYTVHRTFNVPCHPNEVMGMVYFKGEALHTFGMDKCRRVEVLNLFKPDSPVLLLEGQGYNTGVIVMRWSRPVGPHDIRLVLSYEYHLENEANVYHFMPAS